MLLVKFCFPKSSAKKSGSLDILLLKGKWFYDDALLEGNDGRIDCRYDSRSFLSTKKRQNLQLHEA